MSPFKTRRCRLSNKRLEFIGRYLLRDADKQELSVNGDPGVRLSKTVQDSDDNAWITYSRDTGFILALFGWVHEPRVRGRIIWMVGTKALNDYKSPFYHVSKQILEHWLDESGILHNFIDTRNVMHMQWLEGLGFSFPEELSLDINGVKFQYFVKEK
ncbi:MAG: hypothetical protein JRC86_03565 [Deltaproteobacteria bacterium]|nr:hypothetical protein [Deltaproteobacteria bacterium]